MLKRLSLLFSDYWVSYFYFIYRHRYIPKFRSPRSFSEKMSYVKLFNKNRVRANITDRLWIRGYVSDKSSDAKLVDILWSGENFTLDVWSELPEEFVLKANHGSQMTRIVKKSDVSFEEIHELTHQWMQNDYARYGREWFYYDQRRYLIVEKLLSFDGDVPPDYKFYCSKGRVELVQVDISRFEDHRRNLYDRDFNKLDVDLVYRSGSEVEKPKNYEDAIKIAEELSVDFDFIRVDLYLLDDGVYFGELTNTPEAGFGRFSRKSFDFYLGSRLPDFIDS